MSQFHLSWKRTFLKFHYRSALATLAVQKVEKGSVVTLSLALGETLAKDHSVLFVN